ncbi:MAG: helix-turn-helix domain-containing protein [Candidatus Cryosericum sp.]
MPAPLFSPEKFLQKIRIIMERAGIKNAFAFEKKIGMRGALGRWQGGKDKPTPESLLRIKKCFNISLDWLLSPDDEVLGISEEGPDSYAAISYAPVNIELLGKVIPMAEKTLKEEKKKLTGERFAAFIAMLYEHHAEARSEPSEYIARRFLIFFSTDGNQEGK